LTTAKWPFASKPDNGEPHECSDDNPWIAEEPAADETTAADAKPGKIKIEREQIKLEKRLCREVGKAITDFNMIEEGDKIMVCMSGGKDSYTLLDILRKLQKRAREVRPGGREPGPEAARLPRACAARVLQEHRRGLPHREPGHLQRRQARGARGQDHLRPVLAPAPRHPVQGGRRAGLHQGGAGPPPRRHRADADAQHVLRRPHEGHAAQAGQRRRQACGDPPLAYVPEKDTTRWAQYQNFPIIPCNLCGSQDGLQRVAMGEMLREWDKKFPGRIESMFRAMGNIVTTHMMDPSCTTSRTPRPRALPTRTATWLSTTKSCRPPPLPGGLQVVQLG
jgi:tRNA 2-thiocytidine biosynthesis protein TtcA